MSGTTKPKDEVGPMFRMALDFAPILIFFVVNAVATGPKILRVIVATA